MSIDFSKTSPDVLAQNMASMYMQNSQAQLDSQSKAVRERGDALNQLQKSLQDYRSSMTTLTGKKSALAMSATASPEGIVSASAKGNAQPGNYALFVEQLASAQQLALGSLSGTAVQAGDKFSVKLKGGDSFEVVLDGADRDANGELSPTELALAINRASGNSGKVNAMVLSSGGSSQLVLSAGKTGLDAAITLDLSGLDRNTVLQSALQTQTELTAARDAVVWLGEPGKGVKMSQGSNTFENIEGVSFTVSKAMKQAEVDADGKVLKPADAPVQLSVTRNDTETRGNVQAFLDGYNRMVKSIDTLTASGKDGKGAGALANDSSIRGLKSQLNNLLRQPYDGVTLGQLGISASRDGSLTLDSKKLDEALKKQPDVLDRYFNGSDKNGVLKQSSDYLDKWLNGSSGLLKQRKESDERLQKSLDQRQERIQQQFQQSYSRYLAQFSQLQAMQDQMKQTMSMLDM